METVHAAVHAPERAHLSREGTQSGSGDLDDPHVPRTEGRLVSVLDELEASWRRCGAPIAGALPPD
jgi:hypothetical protein